MTISNSTARVNAASRSVITSNDGTEPASTTESPAPQRADPSAPFKLNAQTILEPLGAPAPSAKDVEIDPAANGTVQSSQKANSSGKCAGQVNQEVTDTPIEVRGLDGSRAGPIFAEDTKEMKDVEEEKCKQAKNPGKAPGTSNT